MEPTTMILLSTAMQAVGTLISGGAEARNQENAAAMADYNAQVSRNQATQALQVSTAEQIAQQRKTRQVMGMQRAATAESGLGFGGTNADLLERTGTLSELDQLNIAYSGAVRSQGFLAQADLDSFNASVARKNASAARTMSLFKAAGSVIGGANSFRSMSPGVGSAGRGSGGTSMSLFGNYGMVA